MSATHAGNGWPGHGRVVLVCGGSVLSVIAAAVLTAALPPLHATPTVLFFATVAVAAWWGGRGPAVLTTLLSILCVDFLFVAPHYSILTSLADLVRFAAFTLVAFLVWYLQNQYQRLAAALSLANDVLEDRVRERTADLAAANGLLTAEVEERRRAEAGLKETEAKLRVAVGTAEAALAEKAVLLRELQHRVKNNLQIINSLLNLQAARVRDPADREMFKDCQNRVRAIARVHDRLFRAPGGSLIDLATYLDDLVRSLVRGYHVGPAAVVPKVVVEETALTADHLIPCVLIVNELVCNALKYAFPAGRPGEVRVEVRRRDGEIHLTVADDGVGISAGTPHGNGVGRQIVQALVDQLSGHLEWANGRGTSVTVTFPESRLEK